MGRIMNDNQIIFTCNLFNSIYFDRLASEIYRYNRFCICCYLNLYLIRIDIVSIRLNISEHRRSACI
ncbi:hypothetical protein D3C80_2150330 [compost metagenome]